jgi:hypothetical protein
MHGNEVSAAANPATMSRQAVVGGSFCRESMYLL